MDRTRWETLIARLLAVGAMARDKPIDWTSVETKLGVVLREDHKFLLNKLGDFFIYDTFPVSGPRDHWMRDPQSELDICFLNEQFRSHYVTAHEEFNVVPNFRPSLPQDRSFLAFSVPTGEYSQAFGFFVHAEALSEEVWFIDPLSSTDECIAPSLADFLERALDGIVQPGLEPIMDRRPIIAPVANED